jgi:DNA-binding PadR family transcriptional regulator
MSLKFALLGVLSMREMSGYDIKRQFDRAVHFVWNASDSQIYRELRDLEKQGLIASRTIEQTGKPNKFLYRPTDAGLDELDAWLTSPAEAPYGKDRFLMRLFFMGRVDPESAVAVLEDRREQVCALLRVAEERLLVFTDLSRSQHPDLLWWQMRLIEGFQQMHTAQLTWIDSLIQAVKGHDVEAD